MRTKLWPFIIFCALSLVSCIKQGVDPSTILGMPISTKNDIGLAALERKWSIDKIDTYTLDFAGNQSNKLTYKQPLSDSNYVAFGKDSVCLWKTDHYYAYGENGSGIIPQNNFRESSFHYSLHGQAIDLVAPQGPNGPSAVSEYENATVLTPTTLVIHSTYSSNDGKWLVSDTYFTR